MHIDRHAELFASVMPTLLRWWTNLVPFLFSWIKSSYCTCPGIKCLIQCSVVFRTQVHKTCQNKFTLSTSFLTNFSILKARANGSNIVGPNSLQAFADHVVCCCDLLEVLDEVWNWSNFKANKCHCQHFYCFAVIEAWSNNVAFACTAHPTMLRRCTRTTCHVSTQIHANKKSTWRRRWKTSQSPLYSHLKARHVASVCTHRATRDNIVGPNIVACCCERLHWSSFVHFLCHKQLILHVIETQHIVVLILLGLVHWFKKKTGPSFYSQEIYGGHLVRPLRCETSVCKSIDKTSMARIPASSFY